MTQSQEELAKEYFKKVYPREQWDDAYDSVQKGFRRLAAHVQRPEKNAEVEWPEIPYEGYHPEYRQGARMMLNVCKAAVEKAKEPS